MRGGGPNASTDEASGPRQVHVSGFSWPETEGRMNQLSRALPVSGSVTSSVPVDEDMTGDSPPRPSLSSGLGFLLAPSRGSIIGSPLGSSPMGNLSLLNFLMVATE